MKTHLFEHQAFLRGLIVLAAFSSMVTVGCGRGTSVYSDPSETANVVTPISIDDGPALPKDFYNQSVNHASVDLQLDTVTATSKAFRFQTSSGANSAGGFNGSGSGNRALLGLGSWSSRPVSQAGTITFDAKTFAGSEKIGVNLQIDLKCDGTLVRVVNASGAAIALQPTSNAQDGYTRFTASTTTAIWLSPTSAIVDPSSSATLVPASGSPVSLSSLLAAYPAACLKNSATGAVDLPLGFPTSAILLSLGDDSTITTNSTFVRRLTVGSEVFEGLE